MTKRECNQCFEVLPLTLENYSRIPTNKSGFSNKCKKCINLNRKELAKRRKYNNAPIKQYKPRAKKYGFTYEYRIPLGPGKSFKRSGTMKGTSISDIESQIKKAITKPVTNVIVKPIMTGASGADARFFNGYNKKRFKDYPN